MKRILNLARQRIAFAFLILLFVRVSASGAEVDKTEGPKPAERRDALLAKAAVALLEPRESFDLCVAQFKLGRIAEALTVAQLALGSTKIPAERAAFMGVIAQCRGAFGDITNAAAAALEGQRLNPHSRELALLRLAYFSKLGDLAQAESARDCLAHTDPNSAAPVLSVIGGVVIVTIGAKVINVLADAYQIWFEEELKRGRNPHTWADREEVKTAALVLEKLWELGPIILTIPGVPRTPVSTK